MENSPHPNIAPSEPHLPPPEQSYNPPPPNDNVFQPTVHEPAQQFNQPVYQNPQPAAPPAPVHPPSNPGLIVLQWLTYAFWGWTVLAVSVLTATVIATFINDIEDVGFTPYAIAAVLVLLPISIVTDHLYSRKEPAKKTGGASVVLIIHAVLFALFGIGSLIAAVISVVIMFTSSSGSKAPEVALISSIIIFILYCEVFLRTMAPARLPWIRRFFTIFMIAVVGIICILGFLGPVSKARVTRTDKLIEDNLGQVSDEVNHYATQNKRLPSDLNSLDLNGDAKKLVTDNLLVYKPNTRPAGPDDIDPYGNYAPLASGTKYTTYYYQICVEFKKAKKDPYGSSRYDSEGLDSSGYTTYTNAYYHDEGQTCYKLKTTGY
jgi:hypothetical protein